MSLIFLDTETTGLDPNHHSVWEIACAYEEGPIASSFVAHSLEKADPTALEMNNYFERVAGPRAFDLRASAEFEANLRKALEGNTVVAANPRFDMNMLAARWGIEPWHYRSLDIETYAMPFFGWRKPRGMKAIYDTLVGECRWDVPEPDHTAAGDVDTLRTVFKILRGSYSEWVTVLEDAS